MQEQVRTKRERVRKVQYVKVPIEESRRTRGLVRSAHAFIVSRIEHLKKDDVPCYQSALSWYGSERAWRRSHVDAAFAFRHALNSVNGDRTSQQVVLHTRNLKLS